jgi:hypothetical protein
MSIEKYINACLDRKKKPAGIGGPVDLVAVMALAQYADKNRSEAMNMGHEGSCLTDQEMAAFIELKRRYSGYDRVVRHMAGCTECRRKVFDLSRLTPAGPAHPPVDIIDRAFAEARSRIVERKRLSGKRMFPLLAAAAAVVIALSGLLYQVFRPQPGAAYITFFAGSIELIHNGKPATPSVKLLLADADSIKTGANSFVLLQVEETIVIKIAENSTVTMKSILNRKNRELFTDRGMVLSRVVKLPGDTMYKVGTPAMVASVRGTEFSVRYRPGTAVLAVRRGAVGVSTGKEGKETLVPAGTTAMFTGKEKRRMISDSESRQLETVSKIPVVHGIETKAETEILDLLEPLLGKMTKPEAALEKMKAKYGHIHTVTLYNGKVIEGIILSRGKNYIILTPKGKIIVPERQIRATRARYVRDSSN